MAEMPKVTPYNASEVIEYLRARALRLLMSDEVPSIYGPEAAALFDLVGDMDGESVNAIIAAFERDGELAA